MSPRPRGKRGLCEEGLTPRPLHSSPWVGLPGPHPGFLSFHDERNQRRAGAAPLDPWYEVPALFALAALRSGSRRAGFCHRKRPICHFEMVGESVLLFPLALTKRNILLLIRGAVGD